MEEGSEGSTTHALCQLAGINGNPCHARIKANTTKLKQHLNSLLHDMVSKEKSAAFWQAR